MILLSGLGLLAAAIALLRSFRGRADQPVSRPEWIDIFLALVITAGAAMGVMLVVLGTASYLPSFG